MILNEKIYKIKIWNDEKLGALIALDTETTIEPFTNTPDLVVGSAYDGNNTIYLIRNFSIDGFLQRNRHASFIFHNAPFDIDVCDKATEDWSPYPLYDTNRIFDTSVLYRLYFLATEGYVPKRFSLQKLALDLLGLEIEKGEERVTFSQYLNEPLESMSKEHTEYAAKDAVVTWLVYFKLRALIAPLDTYNTLLSQHIQVKGDLALNHIYKRGIEFDTNRRDKWLKAADSRLSKLQNRLATWGWVRGQKGIKERYENILNHLNISHLLPRTKDNSISMAAEDLAVFSDIPFISDLIAFLDIEQESAFVRDLTGNRIHPQYDLLKVTGRTGAKKPNIQNLPREGFIRSMYVAKQGCKLIISDYNSIELSALSQVLLNRYTNSTMADKINDGIDLHTYYAGIYHNKDEDLISKQERQQAKAPNFGFPGGLGIDTYIQFSKGYGVSKTRKEAQKDKDVWFKAYPEMRKYLSDTHEGTMYTLTGRCRANTFYCAAANTPFQGLASDGAKLAMYELDKCGFNTVIFCHDEVVIEESDWDALDATTEIEKIMIESMHKVIPDVKVGVESQISKRYCK